MPFQCRSRAPRENKSHLRSPGWQAPVASPGRGWQRGYRAGICSQPFPPLSPRAEDTEGPSGWKPDEGGVVGRAEGPMGPPAQREGPLHRAEAGKTTASFAP